MFENVDLYFHIKFKYLFWYNFMTISTALNMFDTIYNQRVSHFFFVVERWMNKSEIDFFFSFSFLIVCVQHVLSNVWQNFEDIVFFIGTCAYVMYDFTWEYSWKFHYNSYVWKARWWLKILENRLFVHENWVILRSWWKNCLEEIEFWRRKFSDRLICMFDDEHWKVFSSIFINFPTWSHFFTFLAVSTTSLCLTLKLYDPSSNFIQNVLNSEFTALQPF